MEAMDKLNRRYGKDKIRLGNLDFKSNYGRKKLSANYEDFLKTILYPRQITGFNKTNVKFYIIP